MKQPEVQAKYQYTMWLCGINVVLITVITFLVVVVVIVSMDRI
jgi:hypothetical protein